MARKAEPGISYYPVKVNHTQNSKIKLLFNEFGSDGYWIWKCLLDRIYEDKGYFMEVSNKDELELFAVDVCKKKVATVNEVIAGCVRRGLFSKSVFDMFGVLTSDRIQINYVEATSERRRKGTEISMNEEFLLIEEDENWKNIIVTRKNEIDPRKNEEIPRHNPQSRVEKSKVNKSRVKTEESPRHLFSESEIFSKEVFEEKLKGTVYEMANVDWYHERINNWADSKNEKKSNWLAAAKNWMADDMKDGKFITIDFKPPVNGHKNKPGSKVESVQSAFSKIDSMPD